MRNKVPLLSVIAWPERWSRVSIKMWAHQSLIFFCQMSLSLITSILFSCNRTQARSRIGRGIVLDPKLAFDIINRCIPFGASPSVFLWCVLVQWNHFLTYRTGPSFISTATFNKFPKLKCTQECFWLLDHRDVITVHLFLFCWYFVLMQTDERKFFDPDLNLRYCNHCIRYAY